MKIGARILTLPFALAVILQSAGCSTTNFNSTGGANSPCEGGNYGWRRCVIQVQVKDGVYSVWPKTLYLPDRIGTVVVWSLPPGVKFDSEGVVLDPDGRGHIVEGRFSDITGWKSAGPDSSYFRYLVADAGEFCREYTLYIIAPDGSRQPVDPTIANGGSYMVPAPLGTRVEDVKLKCTYGP